LKEGDFIATGGTSAVAVPEPFALFVGNVESGAFAFLMERAPVVAGFWGTFKEVETDEKVRERQPLFAGFDGVHFWHFSTKTAIGRL
jgi:hypothetical protein